MAEPNDTSVNQLPDLDKQGQPLKSRVATAEQAQEISNRFIMLDQVRATRRLTVQGKFNGNAPKSKNEMLAAKRGGDSNINWKQHKGQIINAWTPFFDLVCEVPCCIDADLDIGDPASDADLMRGFAEYFHDMVFGWRGFDDMNQLSDLQMLLHGPGVLAWQDEWTWYPTPILASNFYVPDTTLSSFDNCELAMLTQPINAGQLWRKIEDPKSATAMGWNVEAVQAAIMDSANNDAIQAYGKIWDRWEQAFKNGDLYMSQQMTKDIKLATIFVQEMDGSITQLIVPQRPGGDTSGSRAGKSDFLFFKQSRYENWDQVICVFMYDIGADGTFHSVKGLGTDIFPYCELLDKINNTLADIVVTGIKPMWQPQTGGDIEKFQMVKWGGGNLIPMGFNQLDSKIGANLSPALEISKEFTSNLSQNTGSYQNQDFDAPTVEETAKSAMIRASERAKLTKGAYNRYMRGKDRQYAEMWRRAINPDLKEWHPGAKEALKFQFKCQMLCAKMQIPWEITFDETNKNFSPTGKAGTFTVLQMVQNVRATRSIGLGSPAMRIEIANQFMANIDRFDQIGQNEILRMWSEVMTSYHNVDAMVPSLTMARDNTNDQSVAGSEDNGFSELGPDAEAFVTPGQNHVIHLQVHVPSMQKDMQACQQQMMDPRECAKRLEGKAPHAMQHLQILKGNPTKQKEYQQFAAAIQPIAAYQDHLEQTINEQNQAAAQQPQPGQPDPEMVKVQGNLQLKAQKDQGAHELKIQSQQFQQELAQQKAAFDQRLAEQKAQSEQQLKAAETQFNIRIQDLTAAAGVHRDNAVAKAKTEKEPAAV